MSPLPWGDFLSLVAQILIGALVVYVCAALGVALAKTIFTRKRGPSS